MVLPVLTDLHILLVSPKRYQTAACTAYPAVNSIHCGIDPLLQGSAIFVTVFACSFLHSFLGSDECGSSFKYHILIATVLILPSKNSLTDGN